MATRDDVAAYICTKNGVSNQLPSVIESITPVASTIVVAVDNDSGDNTFNYVDGHDNVDSVIDFNENFFECESKVRRMAYNAAVDTHGDPKYVFSLDDDEVLLEHEVFLSSLLQRPGLIQVNHRHMWSGCSYRSDFPWDTRSIVGVNRKKFDSLSWSGRKIHSGRVPMPFDAEHVLLSALIPTAHFGWYVSEGEKREKLSAKLHRDRDRWENPEVTDIEETQLEMYRSFMREPELEPLRDAYKDKLSGVDIFPTDF